MMSISTQNKSVFNLQEEELPYTAPATKPTVDLDHVDYEIEEEPPLESDWHVAAMVLLINILRYFWRQRRDIYVSGNTAVYFDPNQNKKRHFRGPDLYVVKGVSKMPRHSWVVWEEGNSSPDFILELASESTASFDVKGKKTISEKDLKTPEYMVYNPKTKQLRGWRLVTNRYVPIQANEHGWLWCNELGLWLGLGEYDFLDGAGLVKTPRFFDKAGQLVLTEKETEAEARRAAEAEVARLKALLEKERSRK
jgi:Uma2 family endonuclease